MLFEQRIKEKGQLQGDAGRGVGDGGGHVSLALSLQSQLSWANE